MNRQKTPGLRRKRQARGQLEAGLLGKVTNSNITIQNLGVVGRVVFFAQFTSYNGQDQNTETSQQTNKGVPVCYMPTIDPIYVYLKKHVCPECGTKLKTTDDSVIINSNSPEAKNYDFSNQVGDVEFRMMYFECPGCRFTISFDEMKKLERQN